MVEKEMGIRAVAKQTGIPETTIRYYDKEGLLPFLKRKESGYRVFDNQSLKMLQIINCLKDTGMSIKNIKQFAQWAQEGDSSLEERYELFERQRSVIQNKMAKLQDQLDVVNHKCHYYQAALKAGTEKGLENDQLPHNTRFICQEY